jgi:hypothetical protein
MGDSVDKGAYRIAVAAVGCALIVVLAGICVIVAVGAGVKENEVPQELWTTASALAGGLLGILAPPPAPSAASKTDSPSALGAKFSRSVSILLSDIWSNRAIVILLVVFGASVTVGATDDVTSLQALAAASGGALVGMLAPAPATKPSPAAKGI